MINALKVDGSGATPEISETDISKYSRSFVALLEKRANEFIDVRVTAKAATLNDQASESLKSERDYVKVKKREQSPSTKLRNYAKLHILYASTESRISVPTHTVDGNVKISIDKFVPLVKEESGARAIMFGLLENCARDLVESVLSKSRNNVITEEHGSTCIMILPAISLMRLPGVPFNSKVSMRKIARSTHFLLDDLAEVDKELNIAKRSEAFARLPKSEERMLAASFLLVRDRHQLTYGNTQEEFEKYVLQLSSRLDLTASQVKNSLEELRRLKTAARQ